MRKGRRRAIEDDDEDTDASSSSSEEEGCDICKGHGTLILCDGKVGGDACDIGGVHLKCYKPGTQVPDGDWLCDRCADNVPLSDLKVVCCQSNDGIVRRTNIPGQYIHAVCALWNPSIGIDPGDSPIRIDNVLSTLGKPCTLCPKAKQNTKGLRVKCFRQDCTNHFHITCSIANGHLTPARAKNAKNTPHLLLCSVHATKDKDSGISPSTKTAPPLSAPLKRKRTEGEDGPENDGSEDELQKDKKEVTNAEVKRSKSVAGNEKNENKASEILKRPPSLLSSSSQIPKNAIKDEKPSKPKPDTETKASREDAFQGLHNEIRVLQAKLADRDLALATLRKDLVTIFGLLKLSSKAPEEQKIDEYVAIVKSMLMKHMVT
ncbi:hypothetical protein HDU67_003615 [Dinochytrium kinnereticum]|nr:hypothetical protein HDU67_003615 [Dinochytrium kinnereticum]